ncbi:MAG: ribonuclease HI family protein [Candidatus Spechtbacterales bacterium]
MQEQIIIHTDGGSRGNPGPSALGVAMGAPINKGYSKYLGRKTNNEAEYTAVIFALAKLKALLGTKKCKTLKVAFKMDSELAVQQLSGKWKIEGKTIIPLFIKIHNLRLGFNDIEFRHIPREQNKDADALVNQELDKHTQEGGLFNL